VKPRPKALIIEDDRANRRLVRFALEKENYQVFEAADGQSGTRLAADRRPDVIILDLELPDVSGITWLRSFREGNQIPVLALSARGHMTEEVDALDSGANGYLAKPFDTSELLARLRVLQRCMRGIPEGAALTEGGIKVDLAVHEVVVAGCPLKFTATEEALFYLLAQHAGKVVTCGHLLRSIWGNDSKKKLHELQVLIARIRKKLEVDRTRVSISTTGRIGYQLLVLNSHRPTRDFVGNQ